MVLEQAAIGQRRTSKGAGDALADNPGDSLLPLLVRVVVVLHRVERVLALCLSALVAVVRRRQRRVIGREERDGALGVEVRDRLRTLVHDVRKTTEREIGSVVSLRGAVERGVEDLENLMTRSARTRPEREWGPYGEVREV